MTDADVARRPRRRRGRRRVAAGRRRRSSATDRATTTSSCPELGRRHPRHRGRAVRRPAGQRRPAHRRPATGRRPSRRRGARVRPAPRSAASPSPATPAPARRRPTAPSIAVGRRRRRCPPSSPRCWHERQQHRRDARQGARVSAAAAGPRSRVRGDRQHARRVGRRQAGVVVDDGSGLSNENRRDVPAARRRPRPPRPGDAVRRRPAGRRPSPGR